MIRNRLAKGLGLGLVLVALTATGVAARPGPGGPLKVVQAWSRPTPPGAPTAVGYMTIVNAGRAPDRLVGESSPAAAEVMLHQDSMAGGVMRMRPVPEGAVVPPHGSLTLATGGYHLMFVGLKRPFRAGDRIPVTLRFQRAGAVRIFLTVDPNGGMAMPGMR